jgi:hypothetical protein
MRLRDSVAGLFGSSARRQVIVREYGRDSLLVWANMLLGPLFAAMGLRIGLRSEEQLAQRIAADEASMRRKGYLVASTETFSLPVVGAPTAAAHWYRGTNQQATPPVGGPTR